MEPIKKGFLIAGVAGCATAAIFLFRDRTGGSGGKQPYDVVERGERRIEKVHSNLTGGSEDAVRSGSSTEGEEKLLADNPDNVGGLLVMALTSRPDAALDRLKKLAPGSTDAAIACLVLVGLKDADGSIVGSTIQNSPKSQLSLLLAAGRQYKAGESEAFLNSLHSLQKGESFDTQMERLRTVMGHVGSNSDGVSFALAGFDKKVAQLRGEVANELVYVSTLALESVPPEAVSSLKDEQLRVLSSISQPSSLKSLRSRIEQLSALESLLRAVPEVPLSPDQQEALRRTREDRLNCDILLRKAKAALSTSDAKLVAEYEDRRNSGGEEAAAKWLLGER